MKIEMEMIEAEYSNKRIDRINNNELEKYIELSRKIKKKCVNRWELIE